MPFTNPILFFLFFTAYCQNLSGNLKFYRSSNHTIIRCVGKTDRVDHILTDAVHTETHNNIIMAKKYYNIWAQDLNIFLSNPSCSLARKTVVKERENNWSIYNSNRGTYVLLVLRPVEFDCFYRILDWVPISYENSITR